MSGHIIGCEEEWNKYVWEWILVSLPGVLLEVATALFVMKASRQF